MEKRCSKCRQVKPFNAFQKNRRQKDGLQVWCRLCHNTNQNEQRHTDPEGYRDYQRSWRERHPGYFSNRRIVLAHLGTQVSLD